jgi:histidyl-tRNA synthetase
MASSKTQPARGMRDFLPADVRRREYVIGIIKQVYERYGFEPLETPAVENIETLMGKYGDEGNQLIYKILKRGVHEGTGEADLALRYDLTVPLARVVAEYRDKLPRFFKRYQIQPVWRADRPARGRFREFYQCDVDVVDSHSMLVEAELCAATSDVLLQLGFTNFTLRLNHREVLTAILNSVGIPEDAHNRTLITLDKLDKIGEEGVRLEFGKAGISAKQIDDILDATFADKLAAVSVAEEGINFDLRKYNAELMKRLRMRLSANDQAREALRDLDKILEFSSVTSAGPYVRLDTSLVRGLSYYTGAIMEISVEGLAGSLGGGGRYDKLIGMFSGREVPACGFSLGLERIIVVMNEREMFPPKLDLNPADVMVSIWDKTEASAKESLALATELRKAGLRVDLYPVRDVKVPTQIGYASKRGIPLVVIIGDEERRSGEISIRDLRTRTQRTVKRDSLLTTLRESL